jgi:hypothetical protein
MSVTETHWMSRMGPLVWDIVPLILEARKYMCYGHNSSKHDSMRSSCSLQWYRFIPKCILSRWILPTTPLTRHIDAA